MILKIIPDINYKIFTFPGGEPHCKITSRNIYNSYTEIQARIQSFNDLGELFVLIDTIKRQKPQHICLAIPYFPGARQDRITHKGEPFTCKIYCDLINSLKLDRIKILDPHSDVVLALLNNVETISNKEYIAKAIIDFTPDFLLSPDAGASKKIQGMNYNYLNLPIIQCGKIRDTLTGQLSGFHVYLDLKDNIVNSKCLIIDDICDGGGTFVGLAEILKQKGASEVGLYVSHGIFSKGLPLKGIDKIYTTNSWQDLEESDNLKVYNVFTE